MVSAFGSDTIYSTVADPGVDLVSTWEAWVTEMQMQYAMFKITTNPEGTPLELMINRKLRRTTAIGPWYCTNVGNWLQAFFLAVVCREQQRYRELCEIPVDLLREAGESEGTRYNPSSYHWAAALQDFVLHRPGLAENLTTAMELSTPERAEISDPEYLNKITFPPMNTFLRLVQRDSDRYNQALAQGLALHGDYWTTGDRINDIDGIVSLPLLALACLGYDTAEQDPDFHFDVESGYLPKHLLENSWYGEFPT
jgi:hypothetical protein